MTLVELIAAGKQMPDIIDLALTGDGRARVFIAKNYPDTWQDMQSVKIIPACIHCGIALDFPRRKLCRRQCDVCRIERRREHTRKSNALYKRPPNSAK